MRQRLQLLFSLAVAVLLLSNTAFSQTGPFADARHMVDRVQVDLKRASEFNSKSGKDRERYEKAQRHLSELDKKLDKGEFDEDKFDEAIEDVKDVVEHNTLTPQDRDALQADLRDLREFRERRGR